MDEQAVAAERPKKSQRRSSKKNLSTSNKKKKKGEPKASAMEEEQADIDRIIDERGGPEPEDDQDDQDTTTTKKRKKSNSNNITTKHEYLCTWMDGAEPQWVPAHYLDGSAALDDWNWREEAQPEMHESSETSLNNKCQQLANWISNAKRPVFLLGAGISAPVLPTFRGTAGLWTRHAHLNPMLTANANNNNPVVKPTLAHRALSALEKHGYVYWVATQNYDNLSGRAGFPRDKLSELHGNIFTERCVDCAEQYQRDYEVPLDTSDNHETGRKCDDCGGILKDNIVHFDETLPWHELKMANAKFVGSDLSIVLGSSLRVEPAASLPFKSKRRTRRTEVSGQISNKHAVIVNLQKTMYDDEADLIVRGTCNDVMDRVAKQLIGDTWDKEEVNSTAT